MTSSQTSREAPWNADGASIYEGPNNMSRWSSLRYILNSYPQVHCSYNYLSIETATTLYTSNCCTHHGHPSSYIQPKEFPIKQCPVYVSIKRSVNSSGKSLGAITNKYNSGEILVQRISSEGAVKGSVNGYHKENPEDTLVKMEVNTPSASVEKPPGLMLNPLPHVGSRSTQQSRILRDELPFIPEKEEYQGKNAFLSPIDNDPEPREAEANFVEIGSDSTEGSESHEPMGIEDRDMFLLRSPVSTPEGGEQRSSLKSCKLESFFSPLNSSKMGLDDLSAGPPLLDLTRLMMQPLKAQNQTAEKMKKENTDKTQKIESESCIDKTDNVTGTSSSPPLNGNGTMKDKHISVLPQALLEQVKDIVRDKINEGESNINIHSTLDSDFNQNVATTGKEDPNPQTTSQPTDLVTDTKTSSAASGMGQSSDESRKGMKQKQGKKRRYVPAVDKGSRKEKKSRPNYFVAVQVTNPQIKDNLGEVQQHILGHQALLSTAVVRTTTQHLTLHVSLLNTDDDIHKAGQALDACRDELLNEWAGNPAPLLHFKGLGAFQSKVLFAKLAQDEGLLGLNKIAEVVNSCMEREGIQSTDSRGFKPHLTILKFSKDPSLYRKVKKIQPAWYKAYEGSDVGWQRVLGLQLCSMMEPKEDGYYKVAHSVSFGVPEGEPEDGSAGRSASFSPTSTVASPIRVKEELVKELRWNFHDPSE